MSYDLFFAPKQGAAPSLAAFLHYFEGRPHYTLNPEQAWYENADTGVYFSFEYASEPDGEARGEAESDYPPGSFAAFNMNFFRPHYFALEAQRELEAFVAALDLTVDDPQTDGMGKGDFQAKAFLRDWNKGNAFACRSVGATYGADTLGLPKARLNAIWRWNYGRADLQERLGSALFVPKIIFMKVDEKPVTALTWGDGIPTVLPTVDFVLIYRAELAPGQEDISALPWSELAWLVSRGETEPEPLPHVRLDRDDLLEGVEDFIRALPPPTSTLQGMANDQVLDAEALQQAAGGR